jgi:protocatechuate 3,4-dioxygenase beta subunit
LFAQELIATPRLTEGPFYPGQAALDTDTTLVINDSITPAVGEITHLTGKVSRAARTRSAMPLSRSGRSIQPRHYIHSADASSGGNDKNFQGYGRFMTDSQGRYYFRTIKPVPYPGRTPHIHVAVSTNGRRILTTQLLINGHPQNDGDMVVRGVRDPLALETLLVDFKPLKESKLGELAASFDIVLGRTLPDADDGHIHGGIGRSEAGGGGGGPPRR